MNVKTKISVKKPEANKKSLVSHTRKTGFSQFMNSSVKHIVYLQRTIGNKAVQRLLKYRINQTRLKIGQPGGEHGHDADRLKEAAVGMPGPQVQRQSEEERKPLKAKMTSARTPLVTSEIQTKINNMRGRGKPLPKPVRAFFEPRFGVNFSDVRVHSCTQAADMAKALNARAFTVGKDVVFGAGQYAPRTSAGKKLLAHELTHVLQQQPSASHLRRTRKNFAYSASKFPKVSTAAASSRVQRKLELTGGKVNDFLLFILRTTGRRYPYNKSSHLVGLPMRDPFESPAHRGRVKSVAVEKLNEVISDSKHTARVVVDVQGGFPQAVILGQFDEKINYIDFDHIDGLEKSVPGAGVAIAIHEIYERYRYERIPPSKRPKSGTTHPAGPAHEAAIKAEIRILKERGLNPGRRLEGKAWFEGPPENQNYVSIQRYQNLDIIIRFKADLKQRPPRFTFESARVRHKRKSR